MVVRAGVVVTVGTGLGVNIDGAVYASPWWPASYVPAVGDPVRVLLCAGEASILGPTIPGTRAATGTVAGVASAGLIPVTIGSATVQCRYVGTAPSTGNLVLLSWQSTTPWVIATAASYTPPTVAVPPTGPSAPPPTGSGTLTVPAIDSGSYRSNDGWGTGSSRPLPLDAVAQGTYSGSNPYSGAFFYGGQAGQLSGATISAVRLRLGARLHIGSYNAALTAHVYIHNSQTRPGGDVSRVLGPYDFTLVPNFAGDWVGTLPSAAYPTLQAGGGISLSGPPYMAVAGVGADPASGQLAFDWTR
jgi:hypothetical protein